MPKAVNTKVELYLPEKEWLEWNRAAQKARLDLPAWIRTVVSAARTAPAPAGRRRPVRAGKRSTGKTRPDMPPPAAYCGFAL